VILESGMLRAVDGAPGRPARRWRRRRGRFSSSRGRFSVSGNDRRPGSQR